MPQAERPFVSAILLAAGLSRRFGATNKLLVDWKGLPLVRHVAENVLAADPGEVIAVVGHEAERIEEALHGLGVRVARNERYAEGMGARLACGVRAAREKASGFLIALGDMPGVDAEHFGRLLAAFAESGRACATAHGDRFGPPALFPASSRGALQALSSDEGARTLLTTIDAVVVRADQAWLDVDEPSHLSG